MCSKLGFVASLVVLLSVTGCGPTPPSPLIYPTSGGSNSTTGGTGQDPNAVGTPDPNPGPGNPGGGDGDGGTTGDPNPGGGNPNGQNPNTGNPNTGNPNTGNPNTVAPKPVVAVFANSATDPNILFVVLSSDADFCNHLRTNAIKKGSAETQLQINAPASATTFTLPTEAQLDTLVLNSRCEGTPAFASSGSVTLNLATAALTSGSFSYMSGNTTGSGNFNATSCAALADGLPSGSATSGLSCQ